MQYLIYISRERVDELFESAFDHLVDQVEVNKSSVDKADGKIGASLAGILKSGLSFGRSDSHGSKTQQRITAVSRLKDVTSYIEETQSVLKLDEALQASSIEYADWYFFTAEFTVDKWEYGSVQLTLKAKTKNWTIHLSCRTPNFSGIYKEGDNYIPTSTNYFLFEGKLSLQFTGLMRVIKVLPGECQVYGTPLFLALESESSKHTLEF